MRGKVVTKVECIYLYMSVLVWTVAKTESKELYI